MQQIYAKNDRYDILTPNGWEHFDGIFFNKDANKLSRKIKFGDGSFIIATEDHRFFSNRIEVTVKELTVGMKLDSVTGPRQIESIFDLVLKDTYDIFNATNHVIVANGVDSHQCDELAFVRNTIATLFFASIAPTLATGGKCIITSTPNSDEDHFADMWRKANKTFDEYGNVTDLGINGYRAFRAYWDEHPERGEDYAREMRAELGDEKFAREILCEFIQDAETLIDATKLSKLEGKDPIEKQGQIRWYKRPEKHYTYLVALDPSLGTGGDFSAIQIFEIPGMKQVGEWSHNKTPIQRQIAILSDICQYISDIIGTRTDIYYSVENNTLGEAALVVINEMGEENIPGNFISEPRRAGTGSRYRKGFTTTHKSKLSACAKFKSLLETGRLSIASKLLISELKNFIAGGNSYNAKIGEHDDLVMATMLIVRMAQLLQNYDAKLDAELRDHIDNFAEPLPFIMLGAGY